MAVDVVGKYRYAMSSPSHDRNLSVTIIVDIELVGRTKVIRLHSVLYLFNASNRRLGFQLHVSSPWLACQISLLPGERQGGAGQQDITLKTLAPGEGGFW